MPENLLRNDNSLIKDWEHIISPIDNTEKPEKKNISNYNTQILRLNMDSDVFSGRSSQILDDGSYSSFTIFEADDDEDDDDEEDYYEDEEQEQEGEEDNNDQQV